MAQLIGALCVLLVIVAVVFLGMRLWDNAQSSAAEHALAEAEKIVAQTGLQQEIDMHREQMYVLHTATISGRRRDGIDILIEIFAGIGLLAIVVPILFFLWRMANPDKTVVLAIEKRQ